MEENRTRELSYVGHSVAKREWPCTAWLITLTRHFWWCIHCCRVLQAPSISLALFSLSLVCKRFLGFASSIQNLRFLRLCPRQEEHYEPPNLDAQIRCLIRNPTSVCLKEGDREKCAARSVLVKHTGYLRAYTKLTVNQVKRSPLDYINKLIL